MIGRYVLSTTLVCLTVVVVAVGVAVHLPERARRQGIAACVTAFSHRKPARDALRDYRRGERRFFFRSHNGVSAYFSADGVPYSPRFRNDSTGCEPTGRTRTDWPSLFSKYDAYRTVPGRHYCDHDPPRTTCGAAGDRYIASYNAEMAAVSPASVERYCEMNEPRTRT